MVLTWSSPLWSRCLSRGAKGFNIDIDIAQNNHLSLNFAHDREGVRIQELTVMELGRTIKFHEGMTHEEVMNSVPHARDVYEYFKNQSSGIGRWIIGRDRCFLELGLGLDNKSRHILLVNYARFGISSTIYLTSQFLRDIIHVPGLRGNPERTYPVTANDSFVFTGLFQSYVASVVMQWQVEGNSKLERLAQNLMQLDLTSSISANRLNDTQVALQVGRLPTQAKQGKKADMVNIADVGFGVSQALPVLVALHVAQPGQLVYLEQPEIHLHPRAQWEMAHMLADAANRGVHVVVETHSSLLLLGIQTLVAQDVISKEKVKLHWFTRNSEGNTEIKSADLTETGGFGDWPENFADVSLSAQIEYLNAAEMRAQAH